MIWIKYHTKLVAINAYIISKTVLRPKTQRNKNKYEFKLEMMRCVWKNHNATKLWNIAADVKVVKRIFDRKLPRD